MKALLYRIVKLQFLGDDEAYKNWRFLLFVSLLAMIMIASAHAVDKKVHRIATLSQEVKDLKGKYVNTRITRMNSKMETKITRAMKRRGLTPSYEPPTIIKVIKEK